MAYFQGSLYLRQKQQGKRTDLTSDQSEQKSPDTATALGRQLGVSGATIRRSANYAQAVDVLTATIGPTAWRALMDRQVHLTRDEVERFAVLAQESPEYVEAVRADLGEQEASAWQNASAKQRAFLHAVHLVQRGASRRFCATCGRARTHADALISQISVCPGHDHEAPCSPSDLRGDEASSSSILPAVVEVDAETPAADATPAPLILTAVLDPEPPVASPSWPQKVYTGDNEWYTPEEILAPVRAVLGVIDVDPASCAVAQARVQARTYYTLADDGLRHPWHGKIFLNPPYHYDGIAPFIGKLFEEFDAQRTTEAIVVVNSATSTGWFQSAFARAAAVCFPGHKIRFIHATKDGTSPCAPQTILYYGADAERFCAVFTAVGVSTRVRCADVPRAQLDLGAAPLVVEGGRPMRERDYCIVRVTHLKQRVLGFERCQLQDCAAAPSYLFWTHDPRPTGRAWTYRYAICPAHTKQWCAAHQVDPTAIPTIAAAVWEKTYPGGDYDQIPWFRFAAQRAPAA